MDTHPQWHEPAFEKSLNQMVFIMIEADIYIELITKQGLEWHNDVVPTAIDFQ